MLIFKTEEHGNQKMDPELAKKLFKIKELPEASNKWVVVFSKTEGDYSYQVVVQNVPDITNNHYHIFGYEKEELISYNYFSKAQILPPVWDKLGQLDFNDYVEIQEMMAEKFFKAKGVKAPEIDKEKKGRWLYFLTEPPASAWAKALSGKSYEIIAVRAETDGLLKEKHLVVNPYEENARILRETSKH